MVYHSLRLRISIAFTALSLEHKTTPIQKQTGLLPVFMIFFKFPHPQGLSQSVDRQLSKFSPEPAPKMSLLPISSLTILNSSIVLSSPPPKTVQKLRKEESFSPKSSRPSSLR